MATTPVDSQESYAIARGMTLLIVAGTLAFSALLIGAAYGLLAWRRSVLQAENGLSAPLTPLPESSDMRIEQFRGPAASELLQRAQRDTLSSYGWVDRDRGVVRVPIDVAIDLELQEQR